MASIGFLVMFEVSQCLCSNSRHMASIHEVGPTLKANLFVRVPKVKNSSSSSNSRTSLNKQCHQCRNSTPCLPSGLAQTSFRSGSAHAPLGR